MLRDLLLPHTDAGVGAQVVVAVVLYGAALVAVRRNRDLVLFVVGLAVLTAGLMGLRTLH